MQQINMEDLPMIGKQLLWPTLALGALGKGFFKFMVSSSIHTYPNGLMMVDVQTEKLILRPSIHIDLACK